MSAGVWAKTTQNDASLNTILFANCQLSFLNVSLRTQLPEAAFLPGSDMTPVTPGDRQKKPFINIHK